MNERIKPKAHFRDNTKVTERTEEEIFKKPTNEKWVPNKNHHSIKIFIEVTKTKSKMSLKLCVYAGPPTYLRKENKN